MNIADLHEMLTEGLNARRMNPQPFQGGYHRHGKHSAGHKGQTFRKRHGKAKRTRTQPHPSTVARRDAERDAA